MIKFDDYLTEKLQDKEFAEEYINVALEDFFKDHDIEFFLISLNNVVRATGGVGKIAKEAKINRQHLYKILSSKGNPSFDNIGSLLCAVGLKLKVEAAA
jgi:probable addiction module antidote protein